MANFDSWFDDFEGKKTDELQDPRLSHRYDSWFDDFEGKTASDNKKENDGKSIFDTIGDIASSAAEQYRKYNPEQYVKTFAQSVMFDAAEKLGIDVPKGLKEHVIDKETAENLAQIITGFEQPFAAGARGLGAIFKGAADNADARNNPNGIDNPTTDGSAMRTVGELFDWVGDVYTDQMNSPERQKAFHQKKKDYGTFGDMIANGTLGEYVTDPGGLSQDFTTGLGNAGFFLTLAKLFPTMTFGGALPEGVSAALGNGVMRNASELLYKAGANRAAQILGSNGARDLLSSGIEFAPTMGLGQAVINSGTIVDQLRAQGLSDAEIYDRQKGLIAEELPADMAFAALTGNVLKGNLGRMLAGRDASIPKLALAQLPGLGLESAGGFYSNLYQMMLANKYSGQPYGEIFGEHMPNEAEAANLGALLGAIFGTAGIPNAVQDARAADARRNAYEKWSDFLGETTTDDNGTGYKAGALYGDFRDKTTDTLDRNEGHKLQSWNDAVGEARLREVARAEKVPDEVFDIIMRTADKVGVPRERLLAQAIAESNGNQEAHSNAGALGVMQLLPETAEALGVDPNDLEQNILGGALYLKQQYDKFGDWDMAHAAYNAGPGAVAKHGGVPPYDETRGYVDRINGLVDDGGNYSGTSRGSDGYYGENGAGEGKTWFRQGNASLDGAQPNLLNAIDMLADWLYKKTGRRLVVTSGTDGSSHADGEHSHYSGWKVDVVDEYTDGEDSDLITADFQKGKFADEFIAYGRSLGLGMNFEGAGTSNVHFDVALDGTQWDGNGDHAGGFNPQNVQSKADEIYSRRREQPQSWADYVAERTNQNQLEPEPEPMKPRKMEMPDNVFEDFAKDRFEKAIEDKDVDGIQFWRDKFMDDGNDTFIDTTKNRALIQQRYGDELAQFAQAASTTAQPEQATQSTQQTQSARPQAQPNQNAQPKQNAAASKYLNNDPVIQAGNKYLEELRKTGKQEDAAKALKLQAALQNGDNATVAKILEENNRPIVQQETQQQTEPVQQNATPENVSPQEQETTSAKKTPKTPREKAEAKLKNPAKSSMEADKRKGLGKAVLTIADEEGIEIPEDDRKALANGKTTVINKWRDHLVSKGLVSLNQQGKSKVQTPQPEQETAQPVEEKPKTLAERAREVMQKASEAARANEEKIQQQKAEEERRTREEEQQKRQEQRDEEARAKAKEAADRAIREKEERDRKAKQDKELAELQARQDEQRRLDEEARENEKRRDEEIQRRQSLADDTAIALAPPSLNKAARQKQGAGIADLINSTAFKDVWGNITLPKGLESALREGHQKAIKTAQGILERRGVRPTDWSPPADGLDSRIEEINSHNRLLNNIRAALGLPDPQMGSPDPVFLAMGSHIPESHADRVRQGEALLQLLERPQFKYSGSTVKNIDALKRALAQGQTKAIRIAQDMLRELEAPKRVEPPKRDDIHAEKPVKSQDEVESERRAKAQKKAMKRAAREEQAAQEDLEDSILFEDEEADSRMFREEQAAEDEARAEQIDFEDELDFEGEMLDSRIERAEDLEELFEESERRALEEEFDAENERLEALMDESEALEELFEKAERAREKREKAEQERKKRAARVEKEERETDGSEEDDFSDEIPDSKPVEENDVDDELVDEPEPEQRDNERKQKSETQNEDSKEEGHLWEGSFLHTNRNDAGDTIEGAPSGTKIRVKRHTEAGDREEFYVVRGKKLHPTDKDGKPLESGKALPHNYKGIKKLIGSPDVQEVEVLRPSVTMNRLLQLAQQLKEYITKYSPINKYPAVKADFFNQIDDKVLSYGKNPTPDDVKDFKKWCSNNIDALNNLQNADEWYAKRNHELENGTPRRGTDTTPKKSKEEKQTEAEKKAQETAAKTKETIQKLLPMLDKFPKYKANLFKLIDLGAKLAIKKGNASSFGGWARQYLAGLREIVREKSKIQGELERWLGVQEKSLKVRAADEEDTTAETAEGEDVTQKETKQEEKSNETTSESEKAETEKRDTSAEKDTAQDTESERTEEKIWFVTGEGSDAQDNHVFTAGIKAEHLPGLERGGIFGSFVNDSVREFVNKLADSLGGRNLHSLSTKETPIVFAFETAKARDEFMDSLIQKEAIAREAETRWAKMNSYEKRENDKAEAKRIIDNARQKAYDAIGADKYPELKGWLDRQIDAKIEEDGINTPEAAKKFADRIIAAAKKMSNSDLIKAAAHELVNQFDNRHENVRSSSPQYEKIHAKKTAMNDILRKMYDGKIAPEQAYSDIKAILRGKKKATPEEGRKSVLGEAEIKKIIDDFVERVRSVFPLDEFPKAEKWLRNEIGNEIGKIADFDGTISEIKDWLDSYWDVLELHDPRAWCEEKTLEFKEAEKKAKAKERERKKREKAEEDARQREKRKAQRNGQPLKIADVKDFNDLAAYIKENFNAVSIPENLSKLDFGAVKDFFTGVARILNEMPQLANRISAFAIERTRGGNSNTAFVRAGIFRHNSGLWLGSAPFGKNKRAAMNADEFRRRVEYLINHPKDESDVRYAKMHSHEGAGVHEAAHILTHLFQLKVGIRDNLSDDVAKAFVEWVAREKGFLTDGKTAMNLGEEISRYHTNYKEIVAEACDDAIMNGEKAHPFSKAIFKALKDGLNNPEAFRKAYILNNKSLAGVPNSTLSTKSALEWFQRQTNDAVVRGRLTAAIYDKGLKSLLQQTPPEQWADVMKEHIPDEKVMASSDEWTDARIAEAMKIVDVEKALTSLGAKVEDGKVKFRDDGARKTCVNHLKNIENPDYKLMETKNGETEEEQSYEITDTLSREELNPIQKALSDFAESIGSPIVFFRGDKNFHGKHQGGISYINVNSPFSHQFIYWHEFGHWLKNNQPELFNEMVEAADITQEQIDEKRATRTAPLTDEEIKEEIICDAMKDAASREGLLNLIGKKDKSLLERVVSWAKNLFDRFTDWFHKPDRGLTTAQQKAMQAAFGKMIRSLKDADGKPIFRVNNRTGEIEHVDGRALQTTNLNERTKFSVTDPSDNSNEAWGVRLVNWLAGLGASKRKPDRIHEEMKQRLTDLSKMKIAAGHLPQGIQESIDEVAKVIRTKREYDWVRILPHVGNSVAKQLGITQSVEMSNCIAKYLHDGIVDTQSAEGKEFIQAMRDNEELRDKIIAVQDVFSRWRDMSTIEKQIASIQFGKRKENLTPWERVVKTWREMRRQLFDAQAPIGYQVEHFEKATGLKLVDSINPEKAFRLLRGTQGLALSMIDGGREDVGVLKEKFANINFDKFKSVAEILHSAGAFESEQNYQEFADFVTANQILTLHKYNDNNRKQQAEIRQDIADLKQDLSLATTKKERTKIEKAIERKERALSDLQDSIKELPEAWDTVDKCEKAIAELAAKHGGKFEAAQKDLVHYSNTLMAMRVDAGLMSTRRFNELLNIFPDYVPLHRIFDENSDLEADSDKHMVGSGKDIIDPIQAIMDNTFDIVHRCEKNKAKQLLATLARFDGVGRIFEEVEPGINDGTIINFYEGGKRKCLQCADPALVKAVNNLAPAPMNWAMKLFHVPTLVLKGATTAFSPAFMARNLFRDPQDAYIYSAKNGGNMFKDAMRYMTPLVALKCTFDTLCGNNTTYESLMKKLNMEVDKKLLAQYRIYGGSQSTFFDFDADVKADLFAKYTKGKWKRFASPKGVLKFLEKLGELSERGTRLQRFKQVRDNLKEQHGGINIYDDLVTAALESRDLMDFARHGEAGHTWNTMAAFANPALQGIDKLIRTFDLNKLKTFGGTEETQKNWMCSVARLAIGTILPAIALTLLHKDEDWYKDDLQPWEKDAYWIISENVKIPKGADVATRFFSNLAEALVNSDNEPIKAKRILMPLYDGLPNLLPTAMAPVIECLFNKDLFKGTPIIPMRERYLSETPEKQYDSSNSNFAIWLGNKFGVSPRQIDHLIYGYTGNLGKGAMKVVDTGLHATGLSDKPVQPWTQAWIPVLGGFLREPYANSKIVREYYSELDKQRSYVEAYKLDRKHNKNAKLDEGFDKKWYGRLKAGEKAMGEFAKRERDILDNPKLTSEQVEEQRRKIQEKRIALLRRIFEYKRAR